MAWLVKIIRSTVIIFAVTLVLLMLLEGMVGIGNIVWRVMIVPFITSDRAYLHFDPLLGWSHIAGINVSDAYGQGIGVKINDQGFRAQHDFTLDVPAGKIRIACLGDSTTFGWDVADKDTWPAQLEQIDQTIETINLGAGAYGLDQMYLWYMRDGILYEHSVTVVALVYESVRRMTLDFKDGYPKPVIVIEDNALAVKNAHVKKPAFYLYYFENLLRNYIKHLHIYRGAKYYAPERIFKRSSGDIYRNAELRDVVKILLGSLVETNKRKGSSTLFVYLPHCDDLEGRRPAVDARNYLTEIMTAEGYDWLDLSPAFNAFVNEHSYEKVFAPDNVHYSKLGNYFVAEQIYGALKARGI
jgi:hypothetical protein